MKTKGEEKKKKTKKKKKEARRKRLSGIEHGTSDDPGQSFPTGPRGKPTVFRGNFIIKTFKSC